MASQDEELRRLRAAIAALTDGDVPALLAECRTQARGRAREILTDLMTESMLEQARRRLEGRPAPRQDHARAPSVESAGRRSARVEPRSNDGELAYYVYGIVAATDSPPADELPGVDPAHAVTTVTAGDLAALVSRVPLADFDEQRLREHLGDMAWVERIARRHEEVLELAAVGRTVIPMRLCSIYRDSSGILEMLTRETAVMHQALELLAGRSEWGVKMFAAPDRPPPAPPAAGAEEPVSGADYLERQRQLRSRRGESDQRLAAACEASHARLAAIAARAMAIAPQRPEVSGHDGEMLLNGVYLVDDGELQRFHELVASLTQEFAPLDLELQLTGPWPAYNFVPDAIGVSA